VPTDRTIAAERAIRRSVPTAPSWRLDRLLANLAKSIAVAFVLVWSLGPIALIAVAAFTPERDIFAVGSSAGWRPTVENFVALWARWSDFFAGLLNSLIVTTGATVLAVVVSTLAGFGYSRWRSRFLSGSVFAMIALRLLPPIVTTLPLFPIVNALGLNDTYTVLIILYAAFFVSLGTMVMRTFIDQIPRELDEAAMMDGATRRQVLTRVILPLSAQGMVAVAIFVIVYAWNEFLFAFIFTTKRAKTAPLVMSEMIGSLEGVEWGVLFAATTVQLLPVLIFVILCQRHLIEGLTAGATKG
jgi:multiple sugar transport system permease protein